MSYLGGFLGPNTPAIGLGGSLGANSLVGLGGQLGSGGSGFPTPSHFWPMNEGSGSILVDHQGTTNLAFTNAGWAVAAGLGASAVAQFDGSSAFAQASAVDATLNYNGTQPNTIAFWLNTPSAGAQTIAGNLLAPTTYQGWEATVVSLNSGLLVVGNITSNQMTAVSPISAYATNAAVFVVITYSGSLNAAGVKIYINGVSQTVTDSVGTLTAGATSTVPFRVASRADGTSWFTGALAFMRTYNVVLTPTQVSTLFALGPQ